VAYKKCETYTLDMSMCRLQSCLDRGEEKNSLPARNGNLKAFRGSRGIVPLILNFGIRWR
jgi:hypothetical protein